MPGALVGPIPTELALVAIIPLKIPPWNVARYACWIAQTLHKLALHFITSRRLIGRNASVGMGRVIPRAHQRLIASCAIGNSSTSSLNDVSVAARHD